MMCRCFMDTLTIACLLLCTAFPLICGQTVRGIEGQSVTLPCSYKVNKNNDITSMCWGRGSCPNSKCNEALIWTDGHSVTHRSSNRYRLEDAISRGIVSLTISQASMSDAGVYCCRIEHAGWFNDEKKNIRLYIEPAPATTPPTTTRRTKAIKTTPPPTTPKTTVPSETTVSATTLLPTPDKMSTSSSTTSRSITTIPTDEEPIEMTTVPTAKPTTQPTTTDVLTSQPTTLHTTSNYTTLVDETTSQKQFLSTDQFVTISHEIIQPDEAFNHHRPRSTLPSQAEGQSGEKGFSDLISGNVTTMEKKESGFPLHILVIAICVALVIMAAVAVLILKFRGKARGHYPFGLDPNLELVSHAENPLSEVEISQTVTLEVAKVDSGKPALWDRGTTSKTDD